MPIVLKQTQMSYKDNNGDYHDINTVAETQTATQIAAIREQSLAEQTAIQQKAEAARSSVPDEYTELSDDVADLKSAVVNIDTEVFGTYSLTWTDGLYGANGYASTAKWMYTNIVPAGTYSVSVPADYRYQIFKYISDIQGTSVVTSIVTSGTYTIDSSFVVSAGLQSAANLTNTNKETIRKNLIITNNDNALTNKVDALITNVSNASIRYYGERTSVNQSTFVYFSGNSAIADGLKINRLNLEIIHPSGATSDDSRGVGFYIGGTNKNGENVALLTNRSVFPQDHTTAHKMALVFDLLTIPYKVIGRVDYYVDNVYSRSYDVNITSQEELDGIYVVGAYFNTGDATQKTFVHSGILYQGGTVVI